MIQFESRDGNGSFVSRVSFPVVPTYKRYSDLQVVRVEGRGSVWDNKESYGGSEVEEVLRKRLVGIGWW